MGGIGRIITMITLNINDKVFDSMKDFVVDPFTEAPETVLWRVVEIAGKAKQKWSPLEDNQSVRPVNTGPTAPSIP